MKAWPVIQRYDLTLVAMGGGHGSPRSGQAEYLEFWLPDEWGNPDKAISSQIRRARLADGSELQLCDDKTFLSKQGKLRVFTKHPATSPCWEVQEFD